MSNTVKLAIVGLCVIAGFAIDTTTQIPDRSCVEAIAQEWANVSPFSPHLEIPEECR